MIHYFALIENSWLIVRGIRLIQTGNFPSSALPIRNQEQLFNKEEMQKVPGQARPFKKNAI